MLTSSKLHKNGKTNFHIIIMLFVNITTLENSKQLRGKFSINFHNKFELVAFSEKGFLFFHFSSGTWERSFEDFSGTHRENFSISTSNIILSLCKSNKHLEGCRNSTETLESSRYFPRCIFRLSRANKLHFFLLLLLHPTHSLNWFSFILNVMFV